MALKIIGFHVIYIHDIIAITLKDHSRVLAQMVLKILDSILFYVLNLCYETTLQAHQSYKTAIYNIHTYLLTTILG